MIKLTRVRTAAAIPSGLRGKRRVEKNLAVLKLKRDLGEIPSKEFKSTFWKPAKEQLRAESHNKCAYCEADTKVVAHGDVEHFRPKNVYWWLAYCYDNYLYSCQICNQTFKSNKFPISGKKMRGPVIRAGMTDEKLKALAVKITHDPLKVDEAPGLASFVEKAGAEEADLIDPYLLEDDAPLIYEVHETESEVEVKAAQDSPHRTARQNAIDNVFGLNREELKRVRFTEFKTLNVLRQALEALGNNPVAADVKQQLRDRMADSHRFAGMARYFVNIVWRLKLD